MARSRRTSGNGKLYALLMLLALAVAAAAIFIASRGGGTLKAASMKLSIKPKTIIIRDEKCISVDRFDRVDYQVDEGVSVNAEMPVAVVYEWGYTDEMAQSLVTIQQKIYEKQLSILDGIESTDLAATNAQINQLKDRIKGCIDGTEPDDLLSLERDMKSLLVQRATYLKNSVQPDVELSSLYAEETAKQAQISEYTSTVSAKMTGLASFYFDGYEQVLTAEKLDVVNADVLNKVLAGEAGSVAGDNMLYRLVNPTKWYAAFVTPANEGLRLVGGQSYSVSFDGIQDKLYTGIAQEPVICNNGIVNMLEFTEDIGGLLSSRVVCADISADMSGFELPIDAIKIKDGVATISADGGEIPVSVTAANEDMALIAGPGLYEGLRYKK